VRRVPLIALAGAILVASFDVAAQSLKGLLPAVPVVAPSMPALRGTPQATSPVATDAANAADRSARVDAFVEARRLGVNYLPGEVLVKFRRGTTTTGQQRVLTAVRSRTPAGQLQWMGDVARLVDRSLPFADQTARTLALQPEVEFAEPNYIRHLPAHMPLRELPLRVGANVAGTPNDPDYGDLQWNFSLLSMPRAWDISPGGSANVIVAVVDTGLTTDNVTLVRTLWTGTQFESVSLPFQVSPDLARARVVLPRDFVFEPGSSRVLDFDGHGTHVASTIAEDSNNAVGLAGMAYQVRVMPVKVCTGYWELMIDRASRGVPGTIDPNSGGCPDDAIVAGIRYAADNGARVINISLGGEDPSDAERSAIQYAVQHGAFVAVAMGNSGDEGNAKEYPAGYAAIEGLMSVGAINKAKARASYSSYGPHLEIVAPGGEETGVGLDEDYVWQVTLRFTDQDPMLTSRPRFDRYGEIPYSGTSMATPHVAGTAALLVSRGVTDPKAIERVIKGSALDLGAAGRDDQFGYGLVQPRTALFGFGIAR